jgi:hypothetical protein
MKTLLPPPTEHQEQRTLCAWLAVRSIGYFALPNAAKRSVRLAARMKAEGMMAGAPDLVLLPAPPKAPLARVAIELKRQKGGKVSPQQTAFHERMRDAGWIVLVAFGAGDAAQQLMALGY